MVRYKINILEELKTVGFSSYRIRNEKLLSEGTMQKIRTGDTSITVSSLDAICNLLHCQPGDLLEFIPDSQAYETEEKSPMSRNEKILEVLGQITSRLDTMESQLDVIKKRLDM